MGQFGDYPETATLSSTDIFLVKRSGAIKAVQNQYVGGDSTVGTHQFWIPANAFRPTATTGAAGLTTRELGSNSVNVQCVEFVDGADSYAVADVVFPENYDGGTIKYKYYWFREDDETTPESKTVAFDVDAVAISNFDIIGTTNNYGTAIETTDTTDSSAAEGKMNISAQSSAVTINGTPADADFISIRVMRDDSEGTMTGSAYLLGLMIEYTIDAGTSSG